MLRVGRVWNGVPLSLLVLRLVVAGRVLGVE